MRDYMNVQCAMGTPLKCHSDAIEAPSATLTEQVHKVTVRFLSCVPVLPGTVA